MRLTIEEFSEFLKEKTKDRPDYVCPVCANDTFSILLDGQQHAGEMLLSVSPPAGIAVSGHHSLYGFVCTNCGHADLFLSQTLKDWKSKKAGDTP
jgi:hypothetical protein